MKDRGTQTTKRKKERKKKERKKEIKKERKKERNSECGRGARKLEAIFDRNNKC